MGSTLHEQPWTKGLGQNKERLYDPFWDHSECTEFELSESEIDGYVPLGQDGVHIGDFPSRGEHREHSIEQWSPRILNLWSLVIFVGLLLALISLAEVFFRRSPYPAPTSSALTFLWTYLPTTIIVFIEWIWQSYDLEIKMLLPWALLSSAASRREQPWTLDYRSMFYPTAMWHAARHKHFAVLLTSAGFWFVAIANVMSTSLWAIEDLSRAQNVSLALTSTMPPYSEIAAASWENQTYIDLFVAHHLFNLSLPRWIVDDNIVLESFGLPDIDSIGPNITLSAPTQAYSATLDCTEANVSYAVSMKTPSLNLTVDAAGCIALHDALSIEQGWPDGPLNAASVYFGAVIQHSCPGAANVTTILSLANITVSLSSPGHPLNEIGLYSTSIACVPKYQQTIMEVTIPPSPSSPLNASALSGSQQPFSFPGGDPFLTSFDSNPSDLLEYSWSQAENTSSSADISITQWFMLLQLLNNVSLEALLDQDILVNTSQVTFAKLWAAYALYNLFTGPAENCTTITGVARSIDSVLHARPISVRILQAMLFVLAGDAILIYFLRPRANLPLNPSSLTAMATLLEMSDRSVHAALHGTGGLTGQHFQDKMEMWHFVISTDNGFTIRTVEKHGVSDQTEMDPQKCAEKLSASKSMWQPVVLHPISQCFLLSTLAATIAVLEALYRFDLANVGLVAATSGLTSNLWSYTAPTYISILGVLTTCYDFHARAVQPYVAMSRGSQPLQKSIGYNPAAHTGLSLLWHSLRFRNLIGLTSSISLLIVPFMKVTVAGLLVVSPQMVTSAATITPMTTFDSAFNLTAFYSGQSSSTNMQVAEIWPLTQVAQYGLPLPAWTTSSVAIGEVDLSTLNITTQQNAILDVLLPVYSSLLDNCTALDPAEYEITGTSTENNTHVIVWFKDPSNTNNSCTTFLPDLPQEEPSYFGGLSGAQYFRSEYCAGVYFIIYGFAVPPEPKISGVGPAVVASHWSEITNITVVVCGSNMTISYRTVTLGLSGSNYSDPVIISIDNTDPMDVEVVNGIANLTAALDTGSQSWIQQLYISSYDTSIDPFFDILLLQNPSEPLWSFSNTDILIPAFQKLWSSYWALWAGFNMRIAVDPSVGPLDAHIHTQELRICQSRVATRILQAFLAVILLCDIVSITLLWNSGRALPKAPYSIGAQMSLLVDSSLLDLISPQTEEEEPLAAVNRVLQGHRFNLGWSKDSLGNSRFGIEREDATS